MDTAEDLRREVWRLLQEAQGFTDPEVKQELAARAFVLGQRAEILERDGSRYSPGSKHVPLRTPSGSRWGRARCAELPAGLRGSGAGRSSGRGSGSGMVRLLHALGHTS